MRFATAKPSRVSRCDPGRQAVADLSAECLQAYSHVDSVTLERMPKLSAESFREASRRNAVV